MKFTDDDWHLRPDITPHFPINIHDVEIVPDALTIHGATRRLNTRGDTLSARVLAQLGRPSSAKGGAACVRSSARRGHALAHAAARRQRDQVGKQVVRQMTTRLASC